MTIVKQMPDSIEEKGQWPYSVCKNEASSNSILYKKTKWAK